MNRDASNDTALSSVMSRRLALVTGGAIVAIGVIFNEFVVAFLFSPDGHIESASLRTIIGLLNLSALMIGATIILHPKYAAAGLTCLVSSMLLVMILVCIHATLDYFPATIKYLGLSRIHYYGLR